MTIQWLLGWWNLVFIVPFLLAVLYLAVYTISGLTFGDVDADGEISADVDHDVSFEHDVDVDADVDAEVDVDADADLDADHDASFEHDADVDADADADADADQDADADNDQDSPATASSGHSLAWSVISWLGVGRVPVSILLMVLLMTWGMAGFIVNQLMQRHVPEPWMVSMASLPIAALVSMLFTRGMVRFIDRYLPMNQTFARRRHELLGYVGEALYDIDEKFGMASVRDDRGGRFQVACRVETGRAPIPKGTAVHLVGYNAAERMFFVIPKATSAAAQAMPGMN